MKRCLKIMPFIHITIWFISSPRPRKGKNVGTIRLLLHPVSIYQISEEMRDRFKLRLVQLNPYSRHHRLFTSGILCTLPVENGENKFALTYRLFFIFGEIKTVKKIKNKMRFGTERILYAFIKIYIQKNMLINRIWLISCRVERNCLLEWT